MTIGFNPEFATADELLAHYGIVPAVTTSLPASIATKLPQTATEYDSPGRTLNSVFQISAVFPTLVIYCVNVSVTAGLLSPSTGTVQLISDANDPPVTVVSQCSVQANGLSGVSLSFQVQNTIPLLHYVAPGNYCEISTSSTGTAAFTLVSQVELVFTG